MTPVRTRSPSIRVTCPTRTPGTSVIAFSGRGRTPPGAIPRSRARGRRSSAGRLPRHAPAEGGGSPPARSKDGRATARQGRPRRLGGHTVPPSGLAARRAARRSLVSDPAASPDGLRCRLDDMPPPRPIRRRGRLRSSRLVPRARARAAATRPPRRGWRTRGQLVDEGRAAGGQGLGWNAGSDGSRRGGRGRRGRRTQDPPQGASVETFGGGPQTVQMRGRPGRDGAR